MNQYEKQQYFEALRKGRLSEIPRLFRNTEEEFFQSCNFCGKDLQDSGEAYHIQRSLRYNQEFGVSECIFEAAICFACQAEVSRSFSEESRNRLTEFFQGIMLPRLLFEDQHSSNDELMDERLQTCLITGRPIEDGEEYLVSGECLHDKLCLTGGPNLISENGMEEYQALLSPQTKDELNGFRNNLNDVPPELEDLFRPRPVIVG